MRGVAKFARQFERHVATQRNANDEDFAMSVSRKLFEHFVEIGRNTGVINFGIALLRVAASA